MTRTDRNAQNRRNLKTKLAYNWVSLHRPAVIKAIEEEAEKTFPRVRNKQNIQLPKSLQSMK